MQMQVFGQAGAADQDAGGWKHALNTAFEDFKGWLKATKIRSSQKPFRLKMLVRDGYGFYLNAKAYNARVIAEWLLQKIVSVKLQPGPNQIPDDRMELCEIAMTLVISINLLLPQSVLFGHMVYTELSFTPITHSGEEFAATLDSASGPRGSCHLPAAPTSSCASNMINVDEKIYFSNSNVECSTIHYSTSWDDHYLG